MADGKLKIQYTVGGHLRLIRGGVSSHHNIVLDPDEAKTLREFFLRESAEALQKAQDEREAAWLETLAKRRKS